MSLIISRGSSSGSSDRSLFSGSIFNNCSILFKNRVERWGCLSSKSV